LLRRTHRFARRVLVAVAGFLLLCGIPATGPAQTPGTTALKEKSAALAAESRATVLQLYALESRLQQARADLARIDRRATALARQQASARLRYRAAQQTMAVAQLQLGRQLRILYEDDPPDAIAILLGATSLAEAIEGLEALSRTARATNRVIDQARSARTLVRRTQKDLAARAEQTRVARERVAATAAGLEQARSERASYLAGLRREQALTTSQIATLEQRAQEARQRAQEITQQAVAAAQASPPPASVPAATGTTAAATTGSSPPAATTTTATTTTTTTTTASPPTSPSEPPPAPVESSSQGTPAAPTTGPPRPGGTMTVYATGYCLKGTTATGLPVGPGIVAVDPTVIPLGTRMTIPGYGEGVAADTGGTIRGARIDVWIASCEAAAAFTRTITITFG
jgi:3D (Asp-Asp-Asp) domain-containing protein/peptidoglycan hydrolase CwlO-like protein